MATTKEFRPTIQLDYWQFKHWAEQRLAEGAGNFVIAIDGNGIGAVGYPKQVLPPTTVASVRVTLKPSDINDAVNEPIRSHEIFLAAFNRSNPYFIFELDLPF